MLHYCRPMMPHAEGYCYKEFPLLQYDWKSWRYRPSLQISASNAGRRCLDKLPSSVRSPLVSLAVGNNGKICCSYRTRRPPPICKCKQCSVLSGKFIKGQEVRPNQPRRPVKLHSNVLQTASLEADLQPLSMNRIVRRRRRGAYSSPKSASMNGD